MTALDIIRHKTPGHVTVRLIIPAGHDRTVLTLSETTGALHQWRDEIDRILKEVTPDDQGHHN